MSSNSMTRDSYEWGIVCKEFPFDLYPDMKEFSSRNWREEDGEQEFYPAVPRLKAYEIEVEFAYKGPRDSANAKIRGFMDYISGRDGSGVAMKIYDTYTLIGRQQVRFVSLSNDSLYRYGDNEDVVVFKVKFKINDPVTQVSVDINGDIL